MDSTAQLPPGPQGPLPHCQQTEDTENRAHACLSAAWRCHLHVLMPGGHSLNMHPWGVQRVQSGRNKSIWHPEWHGAGTTASEAGAGWHCSAPGEMGLERRLQRAVLGLYSELVIDPWMLGHDMRQS